MADLRKALQDADILKGFLGIVFGIVLAPLTFILNSAVSHPISDWILIGLYIINYFIATFIANRILSYATFKKGIISFLTLEFLTWVALFEGMVRLNM